MKKVNYRKAIFCTMLMLIAGGVNAQFNISGEFRMRGEFRDGYLSLRDSSRTPYPTLLGRVRLLFDYKTEKITTRFSLYDAFVFGQNYYSSDTITKNTVNVYEAWFKYNFTKTFAIKLGRMEVVYDDERLFGSSNWSMWGATHDIVIAQVEAPGITNRTDLAFAINNVAPSPIYLNSYNMRNNYKYMTYLYEQKKFFNETLTISLIGVMDAFQKYSKSTVTGYDTLFVRDANDSIIGTTTIPITGTKDFPDILYARGTVGAGALLTLKKWGFFLNGFYQFGHIRDGRKLSSNFYTAWVSYQVVKALKLQVGYEHLSGNNYSNMTGMKTQVKGFSTLYGTSHRGYGYMDMFNSLVKDNLSPGLNDLYLRANIIFTDKMSLEATYRWFSLPYGYLSTKPSESNPLPYTEVKKSLGSEIDLMYIYRPIPNLEFNAAYCFFLQSETMEVYTGIQPGKSKFAQYAYLMITYKPNFFSTEKK